MGEQAGMVVLMGSGELASTMVEVHKGLVSALGPSPRAVFLDTPAGFQLNADEIAGKAVEYFRTRVLCPMVVASFQSARRLGTLEAEEAFATLRAADYVLVGPGSPSYAVRQWRRSPVPDILVDRVRNGCCLTAASAAALTVGRFTLPVYEVYKVGEDPHWLDGLDLLGQFGLDLAVMPHWDNAEGGTHDTRRCYLGEGRFLDLEKELPAAVGVLGLDEHTACVLDFGTGAAQVRGLGRVTFRRDGREAVFEAGEEFPIEFLRRTPAGTGASPPRPAPAPNRGATPGDPFWPVVHALQERFQQGVESHDLRAVAAALLALDRCLSEAGRDLQDPGAIAQGREVLREMIVALATRLEAVPTSVEACLGPVVEALLGLRGRFRDAGKWPEADAIRDALRGGGVVVEDAPEGPRWRLTR